jgi:hypothetical protein
MIDVRDFNEFLSQAKVTQGFGVVEYDDSYEVNSTGLPTFVVKFYVDMNEVDDENDAIEEVEDEMQRVETKVWRFDGIDDVYGNRSAIRLVCQFTYMGTREVSPGSISQWLD